MRWHAMIVLAVLISLAGAPAIADSQSLNAEIDFLLDSVGESDCVFIRNGKEYTAVAARDHLQMKRTRGSKYFDSAEEFIERIASKSSWSGKPYRIRCGDSEEDASGWFNRVLESFRSMESGT